MVRIKGGVVLESLNAVKNRLGEARYERFLSELDVETSQLFRDARDIYDTSWVPLDAFVRFLKADLAFSYQGKEEALIARSEAIIERQLRGVYRIFVHLRSPSSIVEKITSIHHTYFEGVQIEKRLEKEKATIRYIGFKKQHQLMEFAIIGFYRKALQLCGAKEVEARFTTHIEDAAGFAELALSWK